MIKSPRIFLSVILALYAHQLLGTTAIASESPRVFSSKEFSQALAQKAHKFKGKNLTEAQIPQIEELSNPENGALNSGEISTRGLLMILNKMNILNVSAQMIQSFPSENISLDKKWGTPQTPFTVKRVKPGHYSDEIYIVTINPGFLYHKNASHTYVIKSVRWGGGTVKQIKSRSEPTPVKELQDLKRVKEYLQAVNRDTPNIDPYFPDFSLTEEVYWFFDGNGEKKYIAIMNIADGNELGNYISSTMGEQDPQSFFNLMLDFGRSLGSFHYNLASAEMKAKLLDPSFNNLEDFLTVAHGDLHQGNVFYNGKKFTFIDIASISDSIIDPLTVLTDLNKFYSVIKYFFISPHQFTALNKGLEYFAYGYADAFPEPIKEKMKNLLLQNFVQVSREALKYLYECWHAQRPLGKQGYPYELIDELLRKVGNPTIISNIIEDDLRNISNKQ